MVEDPRIGTELAGFRIEALIGRGGMGVVYRAEQLRYGRKVALKVLAPELTSDPGFRERFEQEWQTAARLEHPNIVPIYEAGEAEGVLYIAMRYVEGIDLNALLAQAGRLTPERALGIVSQVAAALDAAHAQGLVHRDVKPGNVLVASAAGLEGEHVYLTDFGVAKQTWTRGGLTRAGFFVGTIDYAAPEQIEGKSLDGRADVYALGGVLYQCLTGAPPFEKDSEVALLYAHLEEPPPLLTAKRSDLPAALDDVIAKALAKAPGDRYPTCRALVQAAREALGLVAAPQTAGARTVPGAGRTVVAGPATADAAAASAGIGSPRRRSPWLTRKAALIATAVLAVAGAGAGLGAGLGGGGQPEEARGGPTEAPTGEPDPAEVTPPEVTPPALTPPVTEAEPPAETTLPAETTEPPAVTAPPATGAGQGAVVFASARDGDFDLYAMRLDGSGRVRLTSSPGVDGNPRWSPDGTRIAFVSDRDGDFEIFVMEADGSGESRVTEDTIDERSPDWSPDGSRLVFVAGSQAEAELWLINADGTGLAQLTRNQVAEDSPAWSPDGSAIAFSRWDGSDWELWLTRADGSGELQLTSNSADDEAPRWSPDGSRIVFTSDRKDGNYDIWVMAADGTDPRRLATASGEDALPAWLDDGSRIVFDSNRDGDFEIFVMEADGTLQTQLTDDLTPDFEPDASLGAVLPPPDEVLTFLTDPAAFPTRREALLLIHVPPKARASCKRESSESRPGRAIAGIGCARGEVTVFYDLFQTKDAMDGYYSRVVADVGASRESGECRSSDVAETTWSLSGAPLGRLLCYTSPTGHRVIVWTHERLNIVSWAQREDGDRAALYRFWRGPNAGPVE